MRAVIVGCGRVGAGLAERLSGAGYEVTVLDINSDAFARLPAEFTGSAVRGDGTDEDILRRAGAGGADVLFALTEGDNRNILCAQLASESLAIPRVVAKINDPVRAAAYASLGLATICRTELLVGALSDYLSLPAEGAQDGLQGVQGPTGSHHDARSAGQSSGGNGRAGETLAADAAQAEG